MTVLLLLILALATASTVAALSWRWPSAAGRTAPHMLGMARTAGAAIRRHPGRGTALAAKLDPQAATGLGLTVALMGIVGGGVLFGVLAYLVRGDTDLVRGCIRNGRAQYRLVPSQPCRHGPGGFRAPGM